MKSFLFWTTGGSKTGLGHVRRCLTLAGALRDLGAEVKFVVHGDKTVIEYIGSAGFPSERERSAAHVSDLIADGPAAVVIIDSYEVSSAQIRELRDCCRVVVIDDLADRDLSADVIVNSSPAVTTVDYRNCDNARLLLGARYALLRKEFEGEVPNDRATASVKRVLITVGGSDPNRITPRLAAACANAVEGAEVKVIAGPLFDVALEREAQSAGATVRKDPPNVRDLMLAADLAVCGGGQTIFELAATGTPAVAVRTAPNQTLNLTAFRNAGILEWAGDAGEAGVAEKVSAGVDRLAGDRDLRRGMSRRGRAMVDGRGAARVAALLMEDA